MDKKNMAPLEVATVAFRIARIEAWNEAVEACIEAIEEETWRTKGADFSKSDLLRSLKRSDKTDTDDLCQAKSSAEGDTVSPSAEPLQASLGAGAMGHLGDVLSFFANLDEGDRCDAFEEAVAFYNKNNPDSQIQGEPGFTWYICQRSPLGFNCRHPLEERSDEVSPHGKATPDTNNQESENV